MNREQRRKLEQQLGLQVEQTIPEYFSHPNHNVRRGDLWAIFKRFWLLMRAWERYNRWYRRLWRWWLRLWGFEPEQPPSLEEDDDEEAG